MKMRFVAITAVFICLLLGCGGGSSGDSSPAPVFNEVDISSVTNNISSELENRLNTGNTNDAFTWAINEIKKSDLVEDAYIGFNDRTIEIKLIDGQTHYIFSDTINQKFIEIPNISIQSIEIHDSDIKGINNSGFIPLQNNNITPVFFDKAVDEPTIEKESISPKNKTAAIFAPFANTNIKLSVDEIAFMRTRLESAGYDIKLYIEDANIANLKEMLSKKYGLILIYTHAQAGKVNDTHETKLFTNETYDNKYLLDTEIRPGQVAGDDKVYATVTSKFVSRFEYDNTIVFVNGCQSLKNDTMKDAFLHNGASSYIGWEKSVSEDLAKLTMLKFIDALCVPGQTLDGSIVALKNDFYLRFVKWDALSFLGTCNIGDLLYGKKSDEEIFLNQPIIYNIAGLWYGNWKNYVDYGSGQHEIRIFQTGKVIEGNHFDITNNITSTITRGTVDGATIYLEIYDTNSKSFLAFEGIIQSNNYLYGHWYAVNGGTRSDYGTWDVWRQ